MAFLKLYLLILSSDVHISRLDAKSHSRRRAGVPGNTRQVVTSSLEESASC